MFPTILDIQTPRKQDNELSGTIAAHSLAGMVVVRADGGIKYANQACADLYGITVERLMQVGVISCIHDSDVDRVLEYYTLRVRGEVLPDVCEFRAVLPDGEFRWIQSRVYVVDWRGEPNICMSQIDISADRTSVRALERVKYLQTALDQLSERISILDKDDRYVYVNHAIEKLSGKYQEELWGQHITSVVSATAYETILKDYFRSCRMGDAKPKLFDQDQILYGESAAKNNKTEKKRYVEYSTSRIVESSGDVTGLVVVSRDKTEEVNTQIALASSERRFRAFVDIAADWYWESDIDGHFTFVSPTMSRFLKNLYRFNVGSLDELWKISADHQPLPKITNHISNRTPFSYELCFELNEEKIHMQMEGRVLLSEDGSVTGFRGIARNLTQQRRMEQELRVLATRDDFTGLFNRREFQKEFENAVKNINDSNDSYVLMYIDVDRLKLINDSYGHAAGDQLIRRVAGILHEKTKECQSCIARIGGDEFAILLRGVSESTAENIGTRMVDALDSFYLFQQEVGARPGLSIGIVQIDSSCSNIEVALAKADIACYRIKQGGGRSVAIYGTNDREYERRMLSNQLQLEIRRALDKDDFEPWLQPIVELVDNDYRLHSYELLLRMRDSRGELVQPNDFIRAAESYGYVDEIDRWVIRRAVQLVHQHKGPLTLSINLSGNTLIAADLAYFIFHEIHTAGIDPRSLIFEITETAAIAQVEHVIALINTLSELGCRFVLDDFGSGLSSFKYLQDFNVSGIKIDGSFIRAMSSQAADPMIVSSMATLAENLGLSVVAEMVEDEETLVQLIDLGISRFQGYYFARPEPADEVLSGDMTFDEIEPSRLSNG